MGFSSPSPSHSPSHLLLRRCCPRPCLFLSLTFPSLSGSRVFASPSLSCLFSGHPGPCGSRSSAVSRKPAFKTQFSDSDSNFSDVETDIFAGNGGEVAARSAVTVVLAVLNRVLYKVALVPMKQYPFFMAQITTFGYVAIYFSFLYGRYCAGIVTKGMLGLPKSRFAAIGLLEALGVASGMAAAAMLPGPSIPILSQTFLVWQLAFSVIILGRRYSVNQIIGCLLVAVGVIVAVASGSNDGQMLSQVERMWPILMIVSSGFQAAASIIKEFVFLDAARRLEGKPLDIFVVNSFGSGFQALFVLVLLPLLSNLWGIPFGELPSYLRDGAACFLNVGAGGGDCDGAPFLPLLYISVNMAFNISILSLVKISSAVVSSLAVTLSVPISIYILTLPLPNIPQAGALSPLFVVGSAILVLGLILYNLPRPAKEHSKGE